MHATPPYRPACGSVDRLAMVAHQDWRSHGSTWHMSDMTSWRRPPHRITHHTFAHIHARGCHPTSVPEFADGSCCAVAREFGDNQRDVRWKFHFKHVHVWYRYDLQYNEHLVPGLPTAFWHTLENIPEWSCECEEYKARFIRKHHDVVIFPDVTTLSSGIHKDVDGNRRAVTRTIFHAGASLVVDGECERHRQARAFGSHHPGHEQGSH